MDKQKENTIDTSAKRIQNYEDKERVIENQKILNERNFNGYFR